MKLKWIKNPARGYTKSKWQNKVSKKKKKLLFHSPCFPLLKTLLPLLDIIVYDSKTDIYKFL